MLAPLVLTIFFFLLDIALLARFLQGSTWLPAVAYCLLAAAAFGLVSNASLGAWQALTRLTSTRRHAYWLRAGALLLFAFVASSWLAALLTEGDGISASLWLWPVRLTVVLFLLGATLWLHWFWSRAQQPRWRRIAVIGGTILAACAGLALTAFHPVMYARPHRAFLLLTTLLLSAALAQTRIPALYSRGVRPRVMALLLLLVLASVAWGLSHLGGVARALASHQVYTHSLVTQKLVPALLLLSPARSRQMQTTRDLSMLSELATPPLPRGRYRHHNLVLVTVDALRKDALENMRQNHRVTPNLDHLAARAVVVQQAISSFSHTSASIRSLLAGSWDISYELRANGPIALLPGAARTRLTQLLRDGGYQSWAFLYRDFRLRPDETPGFDVHEQPGYQCSDMVHAFAQQLQHNTDAKPFFAWLHFYETHSKLRFDPQQDGLFGDDDRGHYLAAAHQADRCLGQLVEVLRDNAAWDRTLLVVSADHGEALGEHERSLQHSTCYLHDVAVPLLLRLPDAEQRVDVAYRMQTIDLLPTFANLLGLPEPPVGIAGRDMSGLLQPGVSLRDPGWALFEGHPTQYPCVGMLQDRWHLIYLHRSGLYELYDVIADPAETRNLIAEQPEVVQRLQAFVDAHWQRRPR